MSKTSGHSWVLIAEPSSFLSPRRVLCTDSGKRNENVCTYTVARTDGQARCPDQCAFVEYWP